MNFRWEPLTEGVYRCRLPFLDVTVGLVCGRDRSLLIDCGTTLSEADAIADDVIGLTGSTVTDVVLTHHHFDHVLGCGRFAEARVFAAPPVADALTGHLAELCAEALGYGADAGEIDRAATATRIPDQLVWNADVELGGRTVRVDHPGPGHTDHDLIVVAPPAGPGEPAVVFCGDLVEQSAAPSVGPDSDLASWPTTLDAVLSAGGDDAIYVPGHGAVVDATFVRDQRDWLAGRL